MFNYSLKRGARIRELISHLGLGNSKGNFLIGYSPFRKSQEGPFTSTFTHHGNILATREDTFSDEELGTMSEK